MRNSRLDYLKLTVLGLILALSLTDGVSANRSHSPTVASDGPDLSNEVRTIDSFNDDLVTYNKKGYELSKKANVTSAEFGALDRTGQDLKSRVSKLRDAVQAIIQKLKATGRWDSLDETVLASLPDAKDRAFLQRRGGLRRILENAVNQLNGPFGDEIVEPLSRLRVKVSQHREAVTWQLVAARYEPATVEAAPLLLTRSAGCIGATIRYAARLIVRGQQAMAGSEASSNMHCQCDGGHLCRPGDSSIMVW